MKKLKTIILLLSLSTAMLFSSCNDWLDVLSNEEILEEDAFATTKGFRSALIGAYQLASTSDFYGKAMTWGMMSALSMNYAYGYVDNDMYYMVQKKNFEHAATRETFDNMWKAAYKVIANCNNLIQNVEKNPDLQYEYPWEREMILAEAKALRALMHFEVLRLFAKAPILGDTENAIPYATTYPDIAPEYKSTKEVITNVIKDLEYAREILRPIDVDILWKGSTVIMANFSSMLFLGTQNLLDDGTRGSGVNGGFFTMRGFRLNYWGVTGLLARVHSYNCDNASAVKYADEIITNWIESGVGFDWAVYGAPSTNPNEVDGKRLPESLVMFWNTKVGENYEDVAGTRRYKVNNLNYLFNNDKSLDYRYTSFYNTSSRQYRVWKDIDDTESAPNDYVKNGVSGCPVLEISEMYYIKAEYLAEQGKFTEAKQALNEVRYARNLFEDLPDVSSKEEFMELLANDVTRDFMVRGQTWFYFKKMNYKKMYQGSTTWWDVPDEWFVLPIPDSETMY